MNKEDLIYAAMASLNISNSKINNLLKTFGMPSDVLKAIENSDMRLEAILQSSDKILIETKLTKDFLNKIEKRLNEINTKVITLYSENIPERIKNVFDLTGCFGLFYKGDLNCLNGKTCAIVGSRAADAYGKRVTHEFAEGIAKAGAVIISGLAVGVDSISHEEALKNNAKTVAVLGGGFNKIYPAFNESLANKIVEAGGLLLSEYAPHVLSQSYHFPVRNRIIAALSDVVLITQFKVKSGAKHTRDYAIDYGIDFFTPVANLYQESCSGNIWTIEHYPGSAIVNIDPILSLLKLEKIEEDKFENLTKDEIAIVTVLKEEEKHFDDIVKETGLSSQTVNVLLTTLKISGIIKELTGNFFSL